MEKERIMTFYYIDLVLVISAILLIGGFRLIFGEVSLKETIRRLGFLELKQLYSKDTLLNSAYLSILLITVSFVLMYLFTLLGINDLDLVVEQLDTLKQMPLMVAYIIIFRIISEEIFFRGYLAKKTGIWISAAIFGLAHYGYGSLSEVLGAFLLGSLLSWYYLRKKNIYVNIYAHIVYNLVILYLL